MSENPKCPYCGEEMREANKYEEALWFYCRKCYSTSPPKNTRAEARAAAMKRDRTKGEWIWDARIGRYHCSKCGEPAPLFEDGDDEYIYNASFCPNCGADMRKKANDE